MTALDCSGPQFSRVFDQTVYGMLLTLTLS
jgi:hypothetical protein